MLEAGHGSVGKENRTVPVFCHKSFSDFLGDNSERINIYDSNCPYTRSLIRKKII
jgi:hypothetical protein